MSEVRFGTVAPRFVVPDVVVTAECCCDEDPNGFVLVFGEDTT